jgi:HEAT repeat protein
MPVEIEVLGKDATRKFQVRVERGEQEFYFAFEERPLAVLFDAGDLVLKTLRHEKSKQELLYQLRRAVEFPARMRAARDLAVFTDEDVTESLRRALLRDEFGGVRMAAAIALGETGSTEACRALIEGLKKNKEARVRRAVCWGLGRFRGDKRALAALNRTIQSDASYFVTAFAMRALAHAAGAGEAYETLIGMLGRDSYQDVLRATIFDSLAIARDRRGIQLAIDHTLYGVQPSVRVAATMALASLGKEYADEREKIYQRLIELLEDKTFRVRLASVKALAVLDDPRAVPALRAVDEREAIDIIRSAARGSIRTLEEKAKKREENGKKEK